MQECHEQIRLLSQQVGIVVKQEGGENDMIQRIKASSYFAPIHDKIKGLLNPKLFIGRAPHQVSSRTSAKVSSNVYRTVYLVTMHGYTIA